jgi:hypothetical protein
VRDRPALLPDAAPVASVFTRHVSPQIAAALLGQPRWKRHLVTTDWWLYKDNSLYSTALVGFSPEEGLMSWKEP